MTRELIAIALAVAAAACGKGSPDGTSGRGDDPAHAGHLGQAGKPAAPLAGKPFFRVDAAPAAPCASGATCEARLVLTALGDYHVNQDYPFKFLGAAAPATPVEGEGAFSLDDARHGTMTVKFRPAAAGTAQLVGTFKLSVCSRDECQIETPKVELAVPVS